MNVKCPSCGVSYDVNDERTRLRHWRHADGVVPFIVSSGREGLQVLADERARLLAIIDELHEERDAFAAAVSAMTAEPPEGKRRDQG